MHVLTLVTEGLDSSPLPTAVCRVLEAEGVVITLHPLDPARALDIQFDHPDPRSLTDRLAELCREHEADFALQPLAGRRKQLLVADMESTVIRNEMLDELADAVGLRDRVAGITERAMNGELDFEAALEERVGLLRGLDQGELDRSAERIEIDPGARTLVATLKHHGVYTALVSGGFTYFARRVQEELGFDSVQANELLIENGKLTGEVGRPILDRSAKVTALQDCCRRLDVEPEAAVTVGDGANDLDMLRASGLGVAYHGKPSVAEAADFRIDHGDLSTLLFFQGYTVAEWRD